MSFDMRELTPSMRYLTVITIIVLQFQLAASHSWVEQLRLIAANGTFTGAPGYARGNVLRSTPGFGDPSMVYLIGPTIQPTDPMCKSTQQNPVQTSGSPRLQATPGGMIALEYQENGHVTLPQNQPGKPANRGTVYIYGTTDGKPTDTLASIHKVWTADGSGGDKRGRLLAAQAYDDGQCYQINSGAISQQRQKEFPHTSTALMGADLWCQNDIKLPTDAPTGKPYTLYWVWDWPTAPGVDPNLPKGKQELYTTCMDVNIVAGGSNKNKAVTKQDDGEGATSIPIGNGAVPAYFNSIKQGGGGDSDSGIPSTSAVSLATSAVPFAAQPSPTSSAENSALPAQSSALSPAQSVALSLANSAAQSAAHGAATSHAPHCGGAPTQTVFQTVYLTATSTTARPLHTEVSVVYETVTVTASADDVSPTSVADQGAEGTVIEYTTAFVTMTRQLSMSTLYRPSATQTVGGGLSGSGSGNFTTVASATGSVPSVGGGFGGSEGFTTVASAAGSGPIPSVSGGNGNSTAATSRYLKERRGGSARFRMRR